MRYKSYEVIYSQSLVAFGNKCPQILLNNRRFYGNEILSAPFVFDAITNRTLAFTAIKGYLVADDIFIYRFLGGTQQIVCVDERDIIPGAFTYFFGFR